jgi:inorganic pyrophosphatase
VLTTYPLLPGIMVEVRPVALMKMIDSGDQDDKVIAVPSSDPRFADMKDLADINKHTVKEIEHFYSTYKKIQNKEVQVTGFEGRDKALAAITEGLVMYKQKFSK